jgi:GNAT superfamily N-acetyltransferase
VDRRRSGVGWPGSFTGVDAMGFRIEPVTAQRSADLASFSRRHGKFGYCSCMRWRLPSAQFRNLGRDGRAAALSELVSAGRAAGVLAYQGEDAVGWCSIAPQEDYAAVLASRVIPRLSGEGVWSIVCFFLAPQARRRGLLAPLLEAACAHAAYSGARIIESYPWPGGASYRYMGTRDLYLAAGFCDVDVPDGCRPVMRRVLNP